MQLIAPGKAVSRLLLLKLLRVMKLTALIIIMATLHVSATTYAQKVTIVGKDLTLDKIFKTIHKETGYQFIYDQSLVRKARPVTLNAIDVPLEELLAQCLKQGDFTFTIRNNAIVVFRQPEIITAPPVDEMQASAVFDVHGTVVDSSGAPLAGANIIIQGTKTGTHTDSRGKFLLHNITEETTLLVSFTGYEPRTIHVKGNHDIYVSLRLSAQPLDEQIVQAYGTTTRRFNTGSISKVTAEDIASQPVVNPLAALEGRVPGLLVTTNTGNPGASFNIQIRGQNTINAQPGGNLALDNPLFVIDGVPFAPQNGSSTKLQTVDDIRNVNPTSNTTGLSPFNSINPSDIESIEVLKDADATAIYGSRGANGVILITTKRGRATKTTVNGTFYTGINHITRSMPLMNTQQYLQMRRDAFASDSIQPHATPGTGYAPDLLVLDTTRHTNFVNSLFGRNAITNSGSLSVSGGSNTNSFLIGAGYDRQTYVFPGSYADNRLSVNVALHHNSIDRKFAIDLTTQYSYDHNMVPGAPSILSSFTLVPDLPSLRNPDGTLRWFYNGTSLSTLLNSFSNPLAYLNQSDNVQVYSQNSNLLLSYQILPGLSAKVSLGYSNFTSDEYSKYPTTAQNPSSAPIASATASNSNTYTWIIEPQLNYTHAFGKGRLSLLVGNTDQKTASSSLMTTGTNFANDLLLNSISGAGSVTSQQTYTPYKYSGSFGRINYIYNNEYLLNITGRVDGSSRFIPDKQWGKFGAIGAGWIFTEEELLKKNMPFLSFGKLRGSYGTTGNDNVGNYQYVSNWTTQSSGYVYGGSIGYIPNNLDNPNYSWSITKKLEGALETGWFSNRLLASVSWYRDRSGNQLIQYTLPSQTGFSYVTRNFQAVIQNTGWEFSLSSTNIKKKDFSWTTSFNMSIPRNKLIAFPGLAASSYGNYYAIGRSVSTVLGYKYAGINDTTGVYQFYTTKGVKTYTPSAFNQDNKFVLGNPDPKFYGGMRNTFSYKGFVLDIFLEFRKQSGFNYMSQVSNPFGYMTNLPTDALNNWTQKGAKAPYERLTTASYGTLASSVWQYYRTSSAVYSDASYIRFKTVGLSYNLNNALLKKAKMNSFKVFVNAQNLFVITKYKGNDPEAQAYYGTPPMRTIAGGLNFNF
jgi:TonB-linked SusC/RagA family outer membrane protein